jgi:formylglycine-generating enzyme
MSHAIASCFTTQAGANSIAAMDNMVWIPGGTFLMGSDRHRPEEAPSQQATVGGFWMDQHAVTNEEFRRFVDITGYLTLAEWPADPENYPAAKPELLVPASLVFEKPRRVVDQSQGYNCWSYIRGANWRHPEDPANTLKGRGKHPVVHIAYEDAAAYAKWCGKELPTEAEWEFAARGGLTAAEFVWGNQFTPDGKYLANTWQGEFPWQNLSTDGFEGTAPVGSFPKNGYGLYDMVGNVWEWTADEVSSTGIKAFLRATASPANLPLCTPMTSVQLIRRAQAQDKIGDSSRASFDAIGNEIEQQNAANTSELKIARNIIKGGSYLCARNYCQHDRPAARMAQAVDTPTCHVGFRCIVRVQNQITSKPP